MNYKNGRSVKLNDRVVASSPSGLFIGVVSALEGEHLRVHPMYAFSALYVAPEDANYISDALKEVVEPAGAAAPSVAAAPAPGVPASPSETAPEKAA